MSVLLLLLSGSTVLLCVCVCVVRVGWFVRLLLSVGSKRLRSPFPPPLVACFFWRKKNKKCATEFVAVFWCVLCLVWRPFQTKPAETEPCFRRGTAFENAAADNRRKHVCTSTLTCCHAFCWQSCNLSETPPKTPQSGVSGEKATQTKKPATSRKRLCGLCSRSRRELKTAKREKEKKN